MLAALAGVRSEDHEVDLSNGSALGYDALLVCVGGKAQRAFDRAVTFDAAREQLRSTS